MPEVDEYRQVLVVPRFDRAASEFDVLLRHRLLRQPRSLERLDPVAVDIDAAYLSVAHTEADIQETVEAAAKSFAFVQEIAEQRSIAP